jgi:hypothetical protein
LNDVVTGPVAPASNECLTLSMSTIRPIIRRDGRVLKVSHDRLSRRDGVDVYAHNGER